jgi:uncharacterized membrane protein YhaH (DUF805 family)
MGLFGEFFGFDGRLNRLGYLWRLIVTTVALSLALLLGAVILAQTVRPQGLGVFDAWSRRLILVAMLLGLWTSFALASRRLRDMGLEPTYIVPVYAALWVVDVVLLEPLGWLHPDGLGVLKHAWAISELLGSLALALWPSGGRREPPSAAYAPAEPTAYMNWRKSA